MRNSKDSSTTAPTSLMSASTTTRFPGPGDCHKGSVARGQCYHFQTVGGSDPLLCCPCAIASQSGRTWTLPYTSGASCGWVCRVFSSRPDRQSPHYLLRRFCRTVQGFCICGAVGGCTVAYGRNVILPPFSSTLISISRPR